MGHARQSAPQHVATELRQRERVRHVEFLPLEHHHVAELAPGHVGPAGAEPELGLRVLADEVAALGFDSQQHAVGCLGEEVGVVVDEPVDAELALAALDHAVPPPDAVAVREQVGHLELDAVQTAFLGLVERLGVARVRPREPEGPGQLVGGFADDRPVREHHLEPRLAVLRREPPHGVLDAPGDGPHAVEARLHCGLVHVVDDPADV